MDVEVGMFLPMPDVPARWHSSLRAELQRVQDHPGIAFEETVGVGVQEPGAPHRRIPVLPLFREADLLGDPV